MSASEIGGSMPVIRSITLTEPQLGSDTTGLDLESQHSVPTLPEEEVVPMIFPNWPPHQSEYVKIVEAMGKEGYPGLLKAVFDEERARDHASTREMDFDQFKEPAMRIVGAMPQPLLGHIISGNVHQAWVNEENGVRDYMDKLRQLMTPLPSQADINAPPPGIYQLMLVDDKGLSPTEFQLFEACSQLVIYCGADKDSNAAADQEIAMKIDNWKSSDWDINRTLNGARRYLCSDQNSMAVDQVKKQNLLKFRDAFCSGYFPETPYGELLGPLKQPLQYFGYSQMLADSLKDHIEHTGGSCIMYAVEAALNTCVKGGDKFRLRGGCIHQCVEPEDCVLAEVVFARLGHGYIESGCGFAVAPAGEPNPAPSDKEPTWWGHWQEWYLANTSLAKNAAWEVVRTKKGSIDIDNNILELMSCRDIVRNHKSDMEQLFKRILANRKKDEESFGKIIQKLVVEYKEELRQELQREEEAAINRAMEISARYGLNWGLDIGLKCPTEVWLSH
ncbi:uncharacterized protein K452DRAFT_302893 [Aplosporella prunicola CBS 121167]|uniref:Uncharacterized protein n=1 Tax=Aplosporella prunicola CBS 121167 TaxID=1176127 RepID=A0A6A6AXA7_9PEZI|nr:uncharacterized protein K452DRAFT_302893 [Aplosporella prunicola CBS 121167]KAF2136246.1 hypothetical protein K452DRAFT_302893 [Aplosporella prunicola CBS 121167]